MKRFGKVLLVSLLIISLVGCGKVAKLKDGKEVLAKTKAGSITAEDVYEILKEKYGNEVLVDLVDEKIFGDKYNEGMTDYVNEKVEELEKRASQYGLSLTQYVQSAGLGTLDEVKESYKLEHKRNQAVYEVIDKSITDEEIKKYYDEEIVMESDCKHILISVDTTSDMSDEEKEQADTKALNTAKEVIEKLNKGENWDDLAKEYSSDESNKNNGGELGYFNKGDMVKAFEEAAYKLKKGKYTTEPVKTTYGYHIIYKVDEKKKDSLKSMKQEIIETLRDKKLEDDKSLYYKTLEDIREKKGLDIQDSTLKDAYESYMNKLTNQ